jgi:serine/threonine protein kinase
MAGTLEELTNIFTKSVFELNVGGRDSPQLVFSAFLLNNYSRENYRLHHLMKDFPFDVVYKGKQSKGAFDYHLFDIEGHLLAETSSVLKGVKRQLLSDKRSPKDRIRDNFKRGKKKSIPFKIKNLPILSVGQIDCDQVGLEMIIEEQEEALKELELQVNLPFNPIFTKPLLERTFPARFTEEERLIYESVSAKYQGLSKVDGNSLIPEMPHHLFNLSGLLFPKRDSLLSMIKMGQSEENTLRRGVSFNIKLGVPFVGLNSDEISFLVDVPGEIYQNNLSAECLRIIRFGEYNITDNGEIDFEDITECAKLHQDIYLEFSGLDVITHKIGEGANRECYSGLMEGKPVVISVMKTDRVRENAWKNETNALWDLTHEAIVRYLPPGRKLSDGRPYIVMKQFGEGENLEDYVFKNGPLNTEQLKRVFYGYKKSDINGSNMEVPGIIEGLRFAHSQGIYHRDLTLKNILIKTDEEGQIIQAKIGDWESVRFSGIEDDEHYVVHESLGAPAYVLPTMQNEACDGFSVGVCMYVAYTGFNPILEVPFQEAKTGSDTEKRSEVTARMQKAYEQLSNGPEMQKRMGQRLGRSLWVGTYRHIMNLIIQDSGFGTSLPNDASGLGGPDPDHERRLQEYTLASKSPV